MARPFWSGQLRISLVSFAIRLFPAVEAKSEIRFHQLNRKTGERVKHQKVSGDDEPVDKTEIVKGYEYSKGQYVMIEPEDIQNLRIPSRETLDITQFAALDELDPKFLEKPYFVTPDGNAHAEAFAVVRKALQTTGRVALGKIAFSGREHLIAIAAPENDEQLGMMAYTMRYAEELRNPAEYFSDIKAVKIDEDQLALATELIKRKSSKFDAAAFTDEYENALRAMVEAKVSNAPIPKDQPAPRSAKVIDLMEALRKSVQQNSGRTEASPSKTSSRGTGTTGRQDSGKKLALVGAGDESSKSSPAKPVKSVKSVSKRRSA